MSELRDRIAEAICEELGWTHPKDKSDARVAAQAVIDALGLEDRRVGQTVSTAQDLEALPDGTVMRARNEKLAEMGTLRHRVVWTEGWVTLKDAAKHLAPLTILYIPEADA